MKSRKMRIGTYLIDQGLISKAQAQKVLEIQAQDPNVIKKRFGRIAIDQGFISEYQVSKAFLLQMKTEDSM